jgi:hypothetical protein
MGIDQNHYERSGSEKKGEDAHFQPELFSWEIAGKG